MSRSDPMEDTGTLTVRVLRLIEEAKPMLERNRALLNHCRRTGELPDTCERNRKEDKS